MNYISPDDEPKADPHPFPTPTTGSAPPLFPQAQGESDRAYEAFRAYLELGPGRRLAAVARKVGAGLRTVKRWAADFDWPDRIKTYAQDAAESFVEAEQVVQREALQDAQSFHNRQHALAQRIQDAVERYLENLEAMDLDRMSFADACKALEVASRLGPKLEQANSEGQAGAGRSVRDQLTSLLDQVFQTHPGSGVGDTSPSAPSRSGKEQGAVSSSDSTVA